MNLRRTQHTAAPAALAVLTLALGALPLAAVADGADPGLEVTVEKDAFPESRPQSDDGLARLLDHEASWALAEGKLERAAVMLQRLVDLEPDNLSAWRELGRTLAALGHSATAARILATVDERQERAPDPELHFIRGQALLSLGERAEGLQELRVAERDLAVAPEGTQAKLWRARIHALRGEYEAAARIYKALLPSKLEGHLAEYESVMLSLVEAYVIARQWPLAESNLRAFLEVRPHHQRGRDLLAWVLESRGKFRDELTVRGILANELSEQPGHYALAHARALERAFDFDRALVQYQRAAVLGADVEDAVLRMQGRIAPEVAGTATVMTDPLGDRLGSAAGLSLPAHPALRLAAMASYETASASTIPGFEAPAASLASGSLWGILQWGRGHELGLGGIAWQTEDRELQRGGQLMLQTSPVRAARWVVRGAVNAPWRESSATVREGGSTDQLETQLYYSLRPTLVFMTGGRFRRLGLPMTPAMASTHADQYFGLAGLDVVLSHGNGRAARGVMFDHELLSVAPMASSVVLSLRHYETSSDNPFGKRLSLVTSSRLEEVSLTARQVLDTGGVTSVQAQLGGGYDSARSLWLWRASGLLYVAITPKGHLTASIDSVNESATGITGRQLAATVGLHVDL